MMMLLLLMITMIGDCVIVSMVGLGWHSASYMLTPHFLQLRKKPQHSRRQTPRSFSVQQHETCLFWAGKAHHSFGQFHPQIQKYSYVPSGSHQVFTCIYQEYSPGCWNIPPKMEMFKMMRHQGPDLWRRNPSKLFDLHHWPRFLHGIHGGLWDKWWFNPLVLWDLISNGISVVYWDLMG